MPSLPTSGQTSWDSPLNTFILTFANSDGTLKLPGTTVPFSRTGTLTVAAGAGRFPCPFAGRIVGAIAAVGTAPTGASVIVDVNKNGTTIYTTQGNRPTIAVSTSVSTLQTPAVTSVAVGDLLSVDVDQIGSTVAGADLTVTVLLTNP